MTYIATPGYEQDIFDQPAALERLAAMSLPPGVAALDFTLFDRIILTGMGSSDFVTIPLELYLARRGLPVWHLQTSRLLEMPELITPKTLLWVTSQSGRSGEVVALLQRLPAGRRSTVVATTNDAESPLALGADRVIPLHSGSEATVSSKSYLNGLAALHRVIGCWDNRQDHVITADILSTADGLRAAIAAPAPAVAALAARALAAPNPRFALIGAGSDATTALTGALILKEAAKVAAEGYVGGAFRHGPMELAGQGMTALLFGTGDDEDITLKQLARDLAGTGSLVVAVSPKPYEGAEHIAVPEGSDFGRLAHAMLVVQQLSVGLARAAGLVPGEFRFGQKITGKL
jgi:glucosamine--fructose-6-phosphate aminotransferase (isomerizing)